MNISPTEIAESFKKHYSTDGNGDEYKPGLFAGLTMGVVVDTDDPLQAGRLRIFCPSLNDNPTKVQHLPWSTYVSPFSGSINNDQYYRGTDEANATSEGSIHYGFWAIPEMGAHVLVGCIDGDPRRRFWIGCMPEHQQTNTLFHGRYKWNDGSVEGPLTGNNSKMQPLHSNLMRAFDDQIDTPEFRSRGADYQATAISEDVGQIPNSAMRDSLDQQSAQIIDNNPDSWEHDAMGAQGYDWSGFKRLGNHLASRVFGMSTPGSHAFVMDDRPFNQRIRVRSTAGHQILLDDTNERIYISTFEGNSWVEMDVNGNIDMYSANRISMHAEKDINLNAGSTIRLFGREGVHLYAGTDQLTQDVFDYETNKTGKLSQPVLADRPQSGEIRIHASADLHLKSDQNIRTLSLVDTFVEANGNFWGKVDKSAYLQVETDINITTNVGDYNLTVKNNVNETVHGNSKRFTYGTSAVASNGRAEVLSFESTLDLGSQQSVNMKSSNGDVNVEAQGNGGGGGNISVRSPNSQMQVGTDGISAMTDSNVKMMGAENFEVSVDPSATSKYTAPVSVAGIPEVSGCDIAGAPIPWNGSRQTITDEEAVRVAYGAGFRGKDLVIATAIMKAESSLKVLATNKAAADGKWGATVGLFQIRTLNEPQNYTGLDREIRDNRNRQLENPNNNAAAAYKIFTQMSPKNEWSVGKWASLGDGNVQKHLAAASMVVSRLCGGTPVAARMAVMTAEDFTIGFDVGEESLVAVQDADNSTFSMMAARTFAPTGNASTPFSGSSLQLTTGLAKLQSIADIEFKSLSSTLQTSYNNLVNQTDAAITRLDQLSFCMGTVLPLIKTGLASVSNPFTLDIPFSFDLGDIAGKMFQGMMPPQLSAIAGNIDQLNAKIASLGGIPGVTLPLDMFSVVDQLRNNSLALQALGLPTDLNFPINGKTVGAVEILTKLSTDLKILDIPTLELPTFQQVVDKIFRNNSIQLTLDI
ncbi:hypothetical protein Xoosp13_292 [Xanthomonas phage Xoo-sp13]|nr:hypothetical protein Xoosp13_292 [Xanthomonas phage Xoo-sp13]